MVDVAGPLFRRGVGEQLADLRLAIGEDDQRGVQAAEKATEPVPRRIAVADRAIKRCAFGLVQVVGRERVEDRAAA